MILRCPNCAKEMKSLYPPAWQTDNYAEANHVCHDCQRERMERILHPPLVLRSESDMIPDVVTCVLHVFFFRIEENMRHLQRLWNREPTATRKVSAVISDETRKLRPINKTASVVTRIQQ